MRSPSERAKARTGSPNDAGRARNEWFPGEVGSPRLHDIVERKDAGASDAPYDPHVESNAREKLLSQAYEELHAALSAILYEEDPLGAGSSVGSPHDEYDGEAARLAAILRQTDGDTRTALVRVFGGDDEVLFTEQLPVRVSNAWRAFGEKISST